MVLCINAKNCAFRSFASLRMTRWEVLNDSVLNVLKASCTWRRRFWRFRPYSFPSWHETFEEYHPYQGIANADPAVETEGSQGGCLAESSGVVSGTTGIYEWPGGIPGALFLWPCHEPEIPDSNDDAGVCEEVRFLRMEAWRQQDEHGFFLLSAMDDKGWKTVRITCRNADITCRFAC